MYNNRPLVSIIVPVYNSAKYLKYSADRIIQQTFKEIEIIFIDDGSTDESGLICDSYVKKDCRCRCIHKKNEGVVKARNLGIELSQGEYICFVDSDDYISNNYIEILYNSIKKDGTLMCICDYKDMQLEEMDDCLFANMKCESYIIDVDESYNFNEPYAHKTVWAAMFSRSLVGDTRFEDGIYVGEDSLFYSRIILKLNCFSYVSSILYGYIIYPCSASHGLYDEKKFTEIIAINRIRELYKEKSQCTRDSIEVWYCTICVKGIRMMLQGGIYDKSKYKYLCREAKLTIIKLVLSNISIKTKILCLGFSFFPSIFYQFYRIKKLILHT